MALVSRPRRVISVSTVLRPCLRIFARTLREAGSSIRGAIIETFARMARDCWNLEASTFDRPIPTIPMTLDYLLLRGRALNFERMDISGYALNTNIRYGDIFLAKDPILRAFRSA